MKKNRVVCGISSSALDNKNPLQKRVLSFSGTRGDRLGTAHKFLNMKYSLAQVYPKSLDLSVPKWHVEYRYLNPATQKRDRFKVYEDINLYDGEEKKLYAITLRDAVRAALQSGYSPFEQEKKAKAFVKKEAEQLNPASYWTILHAAKFFLEAKKKIGVDKSTTRRYTTGLNYLKQWLNERRLLQIKIRELSAKQIMTYLQDYNKREGWSNKTYNNHLSNMHTFLNLLALNIHGVIEKNPIQGAETKKTLSLKHAAYSDEQLASILTQVRKRNDTYMEGIILTSYYACVRSKAEMLCLRAGNVLYDRDLIKLDAEGTKGRRDDFVPLDPELKAFYLKEGFDKLPGNHFLFGRDGAAGAVKATLNYYSEQFKEYRDTLFLSDRYTLYGFKHTRVIHLALAGVDPYAIMQLTRHRSLDQLMDYLRDLGITVNRKAVENSRKI